MRVNDLPAHAGGNSVTWLPVHGECVSSPVIDTILAGSVLRKAGLLVSANSLPLLAVVLLLGKVLGIGGTPDTSGAITRSVGVSCKSCSTSISFRLDLLKGMAVISTDNDQGLVRDAHFL